MMEANSNLTRDAATTLAERGTSSVDNGKCTYFYTFISTHSCCNPNLHVATKLIMLLPYMID